MARSVYLLWRGTVLCFVALSCVVVMRGPARGQEPAAVPAQTPGSPARATAPDVGQNYRIGAGDVLDIRVFGRPEMTKETRVSNKGALRMPFIGEFKVACLTEAELAELIAEKYKKYLKDPQVDVSIKEYRSQPVAVIGAVARSGRFQLQRRYRLLEMLTEAGGTTQGAGGSVHIIRSSADNFCRLDDDAQLEQAAVKVPDEEGGAVLLTFSLTEVLNGSTAANVFVNPGDVISVPEAEQAFVTGGVPRPGPVALRQRVTLYEAISQAGGFMPDSARNRVRLVRQEPGGTRKELIYNVDDIRNKKAEDVVLQANDVIEVPNSTVKNVARSALGVGVGMLGVLPYFVLR